MDPAPTFSLHKSFAVKLSSISFSDWVLKVESGLDGDSLSYLDMMERHSAEERRRAREREIMEEGKALWMAKKSEELEMEHRDQEQVGRSIFKKPSSSFNMH